MEQKFITANEAKRLGLKRYFNGVPCKHGHVSERYVINHACIQCMNGRPQNSSQEKVGLILEVLSLVASSNGDIKAIKAGLVDMLIEARNGS